MLIPFCSSFVLARPLVAVCSLALAARSMAPAAETSDDWFSFAPEATEFTGESAIDLRHLNEREAGEHGFVRVRDGHFVLAGSDRPVRFWGVNGPSHHADTPEQQAREARLLARYGVNLVRVHGTLFDEDGTINPEKIQRAITVAEAMKREGIYVLYSIYFPLWLKPPPDHPWLPGYNGEQHPFAALMFNPEFQERYREWWRQLLLTRSRTTGRRLIDEPAVLGAEIQNEDSYFFWTFSEANIPPPQRAILERSFGAWLISRYGSLDATLSSWGDAQLAGDRPDEGRIAFRPLGSVVRERTARDRDTVEFLLQHQRRFYEEQSRFLRELGFKGLITASNWTTASARVLGPLEKYSYTTGDFIDRHGYFASRARGDGAEWSIRNGHTYRDRSAHRFDPPDGENHRAFVHPIMDPKYAGLPSMISETTWPRPNRYRSEAPLYYASYGALQDSDAIVHFQFDGSKWSVKPNYWMQPWTLMSPAMMGQFPAAALIYRQGLVAPGDILANVNLAIKDLLDLKGTPLPQDASLDELRQADARSDSPSAESIIDPLIHYAGQTRVTFAGEQSTAETSDLSSLIDREAQRVTASTRELQLDYAKGVLLLDSPFAQGVSGSLHQIGRAELRDVAIESSLDLGHIVLVPLDRKPLAESRRMLLQVMSEERATGFATEDAGDGLKRIVSIGTDPWQVRALQGRVTFKHHAPTRVTLLDHVGQPTRSIELSDGAINLDAQTLYYLLER